QLMSSKKARLPNSYSIYNLARALNRNVDYFLGTTVPMSGSRSSFSIDLYQDGFDNTKRLYLDALVAGRFSEFVQVADTIPDFLKTEATCVAEYGPGEDVVQHAAVMGQVRAQLASQSLRALILCDSAVVYQLVKGVGLYKSLADADRDAQLDLMVTYFDDHFPDVFCNLVPYRQHQLSPVSLFDRVHLVTPLFGGHLQVTNALMFDDLHTKAAKAARRGVPLKQYIDLISDS
ncbi:MAG: hypothetical protein NWS99_00180, partial [Paracoccaceae bacterium]|nr:hypothetical protein [Paracoccaceae bacterium]